MRGIALSLALPIYWLLFIPSVVLVAFGQFCDSYSIMG